MATLTQKEARLISKLLYTASDQFANHGCNDVPEGFYDGFTDEDRRNLVYDFEQWNSGGKDYDPEFLNLGDSSLMRYFAAKLEDPNLHTSD